MDNNAQIENLAYRICKSYCNDETSYCLHKLRKLLKISKNSRIIYLQKLSLRSSSSFLIFTGLSNLFGPSN